MHQMFKATLFLSIASFLTAADSSDKSVPQWTAADARRILGGSAWVKVAKVTLLPQRSVSQMRDGGRMGASHGVGITALRTSTFTGVGSSSDNSRHRPRKRVVDALEVRWESAAPVRVAEQAAKEDGPPTWEGEMYAIAVYDVPGLDVDDKSLPGELKRVAYLKRDGKKDLRPLQVDLLPEEGDLTTVVFLFPRTAKIGLDDKRIEFDAQFGRLSLSQFFFTQEMLFHGKLEL